MSSFILDGKTAKELGMIMLRSSQRPILPATVDRALSIAGRNGGYDFGADLGARLFALDCAFNTRNATLLQQKVSELAAFLTDDYGKPRNMPFVLTVEPEKSYTVRLQGQLDIERMVGLGKFTLPLIAYDPFAYTASGAYDETYLYDSGLLYDDGLIYPNPTGFDWLYREHRVSLYNYGNKRAPFSLTITGTVTNPKVTNRTTGKAMTLPSITGQTLEIKGGKLTVKKNGVNALSGFSGDFIDLAIGANDLSFLCVSANASVVFDWKNKYI